MRAVMLEVPEALLAERRRTGADRWDESWDGVLHMVPPPSGWHQNRGSRLLIVLAPLAESLGLVATYETGVHRPGHVDRDYRIPDLVFARPDRFGDRGVTGGPELVVEILSPGDETYEKLPFYESLGTREVLVVNPDTRAVELFALRDGRLAAVARDDAGAVRSAVLGVTFVVVAGPRLRLTWAGGTAEV